MSILAMALGELLDSSAPLLRIVANDGIFASRLIFRKSPVTNPRSQIPTQSPKKSQTFAHIFHQLFITQNLFSKGGGWPHRNSQVEAHGHPPASRFRLPSLRGELVNPSHFPVAKCGHFDTFKWMFPKIGVCTPKLMFYNGKPENPIKIDDLGVPLFLETPKCFCYRSL